MPSRAKQEGVPPGRLPSVEPPIAPSSSDYSLATLQTVMEMQKALGGLTQAVNTLTEQQKEQRTKLDRISHQVYAAIVVLALLTGVLTFFAKLANDWILHRIEAPQTQQQAPHKTGN